MSEMGSEAAPPGESLTRSAFRGVPDYLPLATRQTRSPARRPRVVKRVFLLVFLQGRGSSHCLARGFNGDGAVERGRKVSLRLIKS